MERQKRIIIITSLLFFLGFALLSKYEDRVNLRNFDFSVTVKLQEKIDKSSHLRFSSLVANIMEGATFFAGPTLTSIFVVGMTALSVYDRKNRKPVFRGLAIPVGFLLILFAELYGKTIVHHPSPPFSMIKNPISIFPAGYVNEQFSYPSGHAARAVFVALNIWFLIVRSIRLKTSGKRMIIGVIAGLYVLLVGVSRIYLGEHWFSDVLGGTLLGGAVGFLTGWYIL